MWVPVDSRAGATSIPFGPSASPDTSVPFNTASRRKPKESMPKVTWINFAGGLPPVFCRSGGTRNARGKNVPCR